MKEYIAKEMKLLKANLCTFIRKVNSKKVLAQKTKLYYNNGNILKIMDNQNSI